MWKKINRVLFIVFLIVFAVTFFTRKNYRSVDNIAPELYKAPEQLELVDNSPINFKIKDYEYTLEPLYYYEISGLIVHEKDYSRLSIYKRNKALPIDLCMIWGSNVATKVYQSKNLKFSQGFRFCNYSYSGDIFFNETEISNNHLLISNDYVNSKVKSLNAGDQIKIIGKLVNVKAVNNSNPDEYDPAYIALTTSTIRTDTGAGACEVIYVEDVQILKKANQISNILFKASIYGLILLLITNIVYLFV